VLSPVIFWAESLVGDWSSNQRSTWFSPPALSKDKRTGILSPYIVCPSDGVTILITCAGFVDGEETGAGVLYAWARMVPVASSEMANAPAALFAKVFINFFDSAHSKMAAVNAVNSDLFLPG